MNTKHTNTDDSQITESYRLISDAARLMRRCAGNLLDRQAEEQDGWKIFYAVDLDVIKLYMAPHETTQHAEVFSDGVDADTRELLARLIGDFIFKYLKGAVGTNNQGNGCLFIISPHDEELGRLIFALSNKLVGAIEEIEAPLDDILKDLLEQLTNGNHDKLSQWLIDRASTLIEIFDGKSGPRSELSRFEALDNYRLLHIERYREALNSWTFPLPELESKPQDFEAFTSSFEAWKKLLIKYKTQNWRKRNLINDAYVMAMIEWLNLHMAAEKRRIVLITATPGILKAAANYCIDLNDRRIKKSFAELYVRHPQAFMADNGFFSEGMAQEEKVDINSFSLFDWLNLFFPKAIRAGDRRVASVDTELLKTIEASVDRNFQETIVLLAKSECSDTEQASFPYSMLLEWRTQVRSACVSRKINTNEESWPGRAKEMLEWLRIKLEQGWTIDNLRSELASRAIQSLSALYSSTVWLGLWSKVITISEQVRGIPALRFDPPYFDQAQEYYRLVISAMKADACADKSVQQHLDIAQMYSKLSAIDDSYYHGHVIHALAYATKGHWHAAKTLCKIALCTVDELPQEEKNYRTGREAAYLLAISERRLARTIDDLKNAKQYLVEAQKRENQGVSVDPRFLSENIAIEVAKINFEYFSDDGGSIDMAELESVLQKALELFSNLESESMPECQTWICQQVSTNLLNLTLISCHANHSLPNALLKKVREIVLDLRKRCFCPESVGLNDMVFDFIFLTAMAIFCNETEKAEALEKLKKFQFYPSLPFDRTREEVFRQLAEQAYAVEMERGD